MANVVRGIFLILLGLFFFAQGMKPRNDFRLLIGGFALVAGVIELFREDKKDPK